MGGRDGRRCVRRLRRSCHPERSEGPAPPGIELRQSRSLAALGMTALAQSATALHSSRPHALTPSRPHALTPSRPHALTPSRPHALTPSRPHALTPSRPHALTPSPRTPRAPRSLRSRRPPAPPRRRSPSPPDVSSPSRSAASAIVPSVARVTRCSGVVALWMHAAGVAGIAPGRDELLGDRPRRPARPISIDECVDRREPADSR